MLIGTLVTIASFVPIGFAQSSAGEYTFSIFSVVGISLIVSWLVAVIFAPLIGKAILKPPKVETDPKPSKLLAVYSAFLQGAIRMKWLTIGLTLGRVRAVAVPAALRAATVLPGVRPARADRRHDAAAERVDLRDRGAGQAPGSSC